VLTILPSPLCLHFVHLLLASCPLHSRSREKAENWRSKNAMAESGVKASGADPPTASTSAHRSASVSTRAAATIVLQFGCPGCITHRTQTSSSFEKSWGNTISQDRRCQMLASNRNGHEIVSICGRLPPSTPEPGVISERGALQATLPASCIPQLLIVVDRPWHSVPCAKWVMLSSVAHVDSSLHYRCMACLSAG
jgi:hypothetical protein